jgi:hypothetical protein
MRGRYGPQTVTALLLLVGCAVALFIPWVNFAHIGKTSGYAATRVVPLAFIYGALISVGAVSVALGKRNESGGKLAIPAAAFGVMAFLSGVELLLLEYANSLVPKFLLPLRFGGLYLAVGAGPGLWIFFALAALGVSECLRPNLARVVASFKDAKRLGNLITQWGWLALGIVALLLESMAHFMPWLAVTYNGQAHEFPAWVFPQIGQTIFIDCLVFVVALSVRFRFPKFAAMCVIGSGWSGLSACLWLHWSTSELGHFRVASYVNRYIHIRAIGTSLGTGFWIGVVGAMVGLASGFVILARSPDVSKQSVAQHWNIASPTATQNGQDNRFGDL